MEGEVSGKGLDSVKKRLHLATGLCEEGQKLLEKDELSLTQAQALTAIPQAGQKGIPERYGSRLAWPAQ